MEKFQTVLQAANALKVLGFSVTGLTNPADLYSTIKRLHPIPLKQGLIRCGPDSDGGYLIPNSLENIQYCFSPGVDTVTGFEQDIYNKFGIKSFLADGSVDSPCEEKDFMSFSKYYLGYKNNSQYLTLEKWISNSLPEDSFSDLILQMDIEGGEYDVIMNCDSATLRRFRIIVIEFHLLHALEQFPFHFLFESMISKLLKFHSVVHIHPNNVGSLIKVGDNLIPSLLEFTFLRKDYVKLGGELTFPHKLDRNNAKGNDLVLPKCWWS